MWGATNALGIAQFQIGIPDDVNATGLPYELVAKIQAVLPPGPDYLGLRAELHDTTAGWDLATQTGSQVRWLTANDVANCTTLGDDCHCVIAKYDGDADPMLDYLCMSRHGDDDIDEIPDFTGYAMRWRNGDVCVVPTGEDTVALGYSDDATWDYAGLFLGGFLNNAPTPASWRNGVFAGPRAVGSAASCTDPMWGP